MTRSVLLIGVFIFLADVSVGTLRTIMTVQGRRRLSFLLVFFEAAVWVTVISAIVTRLDDAPILVVFYGLGLAIGNVVGIAAEQKIALGHVALRAFTRVAGASSAARRCAAGQIVTPFQGDLQSSAGSYEEPPFWKLMAMGLPCP